MAARLKLDDPEFWRRPLDDRMADFAVMREDGPFTRAETFDPLTGGNETFFASSPADTHSLRIPAGELFALARQHRPVPTDPSALPSRCGA